MKPIHGPIDYGGYPPRKRRPMREVQGSDADDEAASQQQSQQEDETNEAPDERAARLHSRAQQFRQAAHDVHGFETHGHVLRPHSAEEAAPQDTAQDASSMAANNVAQDNAAVGNAAANHAAEQKARARREQLRKERAQQERLQRKAEIRAKRRDRNSVGWKRVRRLTWIAAAIVGVQVVGLALTQPEMNVQRVAVEGAHLTPPDVLERAQAKLVGQNWLRARTGEVARPLKALPVVQNVRVVRRLAWPPQLAIAITERQPFVRVGNDKTWWVADKNGVPFRLARAEDDGLDAIYNATWAPIAGKPLDKEAWTRARQFSALLARERALGRNWKLRRVYFDTHGFASLRLTGGFHDETLVQLGGEEWPQKLERARQSLAYLQKTGRRAGVLNLITYAMPVWTPRTPAAPNLQAATTLENPSVG